MNKRLILIIVTLSLVFSGMVGYHYYQHIFGNLINKTGAIYIRSTDNIDDVEKALNDFIGNENIFFWLAQKKNYKNPKAGKYILTEGMSLNDVINLLRSGNQTPVKVSFNNQDTLEKFSGRVAEQLELDSISILEGFKDPVFLNTNKLSESSVLEILIPNTYEFYWNVSIEKFRTNMLKEFRKFWNKDRLQKAAQINMSPSQIMTLASIVQKETAKVSERPTVAGLYLNRLKKNIPLQADPTIIYVLKKKNGEKFQVKRVLLKDLKIPSPFNTYLNRGLPPNLISMPDISSINAVLNYQKHNYLFMCASVTNVGYHEFASTLKKHNNNAVKYQRWLNKKGVNR